MYKQYKGNKKILSMNNTAILTSNTITEAVENSICWSQIIREYITLRIPFHWGGDWQY